MRRIGIFRGTFDPFHRGHLESCLVALAACELDEVLIIPESPSYKQPVATRRQRIEIAELVTKKNNKISVIDEDASSLTRILQNLNQRFSASIFCVILGSDAFMTLDAWDKTDQQTLLNHAESCIVLRDNSEKQKLQKYIDKLLTENTKMAYTILPAVWSPIASSDIKQDTKRAVEKKVLDQDAYEYIKSENLYDQDSKDS